jgi:hypothetical protein
MIDRGSFALAELQLQHKHSDGTWSGMTPEPADHDPASHDLERELAQGTIFRCDCGEEIRVGAPEDAVDTRA